MGTESTADVVERWAQEMGLPVDHFPEFHESINDPVMRAAWSHIVQHVRPKQEIQQMNELIAEYEFLKFIPGNNEVEVSVHKPEDVILYKKREQLKQMLQQKRAEEFLLDREIKQAQEQLEEKRKAELSLKKTIQTKQHKSNALKLKLLETKRVVDNIKDSNQKMNSILNSEKTNENDRALILIKKSIKELMNLDQEKHELSSNFWCAMQRELLSQSPQSVIQGALCFCQDLSASIDALLYTRCEPQTVVDFSPVNIKLGSMRSELLQIQEDLEKTKASHENHSEKIKVLFEEINQFLMKDELNQDISKIKSDRIRESIEHESLLTQVDYAKKYLHSMESHSHTSDGDTSGVLNLSTDQKAEVKNTIQMMESSAKNIRNHVAQFENLHQLFSNLKSTQIESLEFFRENINKLSALKLHEFQNELVQVHTWLVQISDEHYSNKINNFPTEAKSTNLKQIQHMLSTLQALQNMKSLPDVHASESGEHNTPAPQLPEDLNEDILEHMDEKLKKITNMFESLISTRK